ncbi:hypothetical protein Aduo_016590 [Ancylostoma duodenale]
MRLLVLLVLVARHADASPTMCHCPSGQVGMTCPQPIQLNCPAMTCPPPPPCNPFPTLPTFAPQSNGVQGIQQFTLPTLAPFPGSAFGGQTTPLPLPVAPPTNGQESLLPIQNNQYNQQHPQQQYQPQPPPQAPPPPPQAPPPPPISPQVNVLPSNQFAEPIPVDATTRATTLPSESYVEADSPEGPQIEESNDKFQFYENQPNNGYRQPVRRALASGTKPEVFTDKCNDERLKKIIEDNIDSNPSSSKRKIQKAATDEIGGLFDVICSSHDFSYLANTQLFCEAGNDDVTCFAFLHSLIQ